MNWHRTIRISALLAALAATAFLWVQLLNLYLAAGGDIAISVGFGIVLPLVLVLLTAFSVWSAALVVQGRRGFWLAGSLMATLLMLVANSMLVFSFALWRVGITYVPATLLLLVLAAYTSYLSYSGQLD